MLVDRAAAMFSLDRSLAFSWADFGDVYVSKSRRAGILAALRSGKGYQAISVPKDEPPPQSPQQKSLAAEPLPPAVMNVASKLIQPTPTRFHMPYGTGVWEIAGEPVLIAHPDSDIWVPAPVTSKVVELVYGIKKEAYEKEGGKTNGVNFVVDAEAPDGTTRQLFSRVLNPASVPADRGMQITQLNLQLASGEMLVLRTRPFGDYAFDWAYWARVTVK